MRTSTFTNSGWSAIVQASGEIVPGSTTPCFTPAVREGRVDIREGRSFCMRWGASYPWLVGGLLLLDLVLALAQAPSTSRVVRRKSAACRKSWARLIQKIGGGCL